MVRGRPSGLKAAPHRCAAACGRPWPRSLCGPWAAGTTGQAEGLPPGPARHPQPRPAPDMVKTEGVIYRHRCNNLLNPPPEYEPNPNC